MKRFLMVLLGFVATMATAEVHKVPADFPTLQEAVNAAFSGDTIQETAGGTYNNLWIPKQVVLIGTGSTCIRDTTGNSGNGIGIGGIGDGTVIKKIVVKGGVSGIWTFKTVRIESCFVDSATSGIWFSPGANATVTDVTIANCSIGVGIDSCNGILNKVKIIGTGTSKGIYVTRKGTSEIIRSNISDCDMGIQAVNAYPVVKNGIISKCKLGISGFDTSSIKVYNNIIRRSTENGIFLSGKSFVKVVNNVIYESNGNGVWIDTCNALVTNNIVTKCVGCGIGSADSIVGPTCSYNCLFENSNDYWQTSPGDGALYLDPEFIDTDSFKLASTSPCINAGNPDTIYNDIDGSRNDMGVWGGPYPYGGEWYRIELPDVRSKAEIVIYPNPTRGPIRISPQASVQIFDLTGRLIRFEKASSINCHLPSGIYIIKAGKSTQKIVIVR